MLSYNLQWFAKDGPGGEKTEQPTAKRKRDTRNKGKVAKSKELSAAIDLVVLFLVLRIFVSTMGESFMNVFRYVYYRIPDFLSMNSADLSSRAIQSFFAGIFLQMLIIIAPFLIFGVTVNLLVNIKQVGWKITTAPLRPNFSKFNPINGFKRFFSKDSVVALLKAFIKLRVAAYVAYSSIRDEVDDIFILYDIPLMQAVALCGTVIINTGTRIGFVYLIVGIADYFYQKYRFNEELKMTKQEVKDEYKTTEGNPEIKGKQRQRMREASRRRMMRDVPRADVVITNPTHLAVAIKYEPETHRAPVVLAKGEDYVAMKIRELANENKIEIVENKPLARMLYANVDIGEEIPPELYQAVAEILAMVYNSRQ